MVCLSRDRLQDPDGIDSNEIKHMKTEVLGPLVHQKVEGVVS